MLLDFSERVRKFLQAANKNKLKMILVGGGAVNFYGYQRHSADIDFWIEISPDNVQKLLKTLQEMGFPIQELPDSVKKGEHLHKTQSCFRVGTNYKV